MAHKSLARKSSHYNIDTKAKDMCNSIRTYNDMIAPCLPSVLNKMYIAAAIRICRRKKTRTQ